MKDKKSVEYHMNELVNLEKVKLRNDNQGFRRLFRAAQKILYLESLDVETRVLGTNADFNVKAGYSRKTLSGVQVEDVIGELAE